MGVGLRVERQGQGSERERHLLHEDGHGDLLLSLSLTRVAPLTTYYLLLSAHLLHEDGHGDVLLLAGVTAHGTHLPLLYVLGPEGGGEVRVGGR